MRMIPLISHKILEKRKYTSHTITQLTVSTCAFCDTRIENLLKGPVLAVQPKKAAQNKIKRCNSYTHFISLFS